VLAGGGLRRLALYTDRGYLRIPTDGRYPEALAFRFDLRSACP
jgi:hypothetical protein